MSTRKFFARPLAVALTTALGATTLAAAGLVASATVARADTPVVTPVVGGFTIIGRGWGHGRGMSQYGAMAAAQAGQTWQQIVGFYYPNTTLQARSDSTIRVGLSGHVGGTVRARAEANLVATDGAGQAFVLPTTDAAGRAVASWEVGLPASGPASAATLYERTASGLRVAYATTVTGRWQLTAAAGALTALTASGATAGSFAGTLSGTRSGSAIVPVLTTTLESYVQQVVPWESAGSWPVQALAAQAVAARSYAAWFQANPRSSYYDICDTTCQIFGGVTAETANSKAGVTATTGQVLTANGAAVRAEFGTSNGGEVVGSSAAFQVAKADPNEARLTPAQNTWTTTVTAARLQAAYPSVGTPTALAVTARDGLGAWWGGRVTTLRLTGTTGSVSITGDAFRSLIGLAAVKSTYFTLVPSQASLTRDITGDGRADVLAISSTGRLMLSAGTAAGLAPAVQRGTGWSGLSVFQAEHVNADRQADVFALTSTGDLRLYAAGQTGLAAPIVVARGLTGYRSFVTLTGLHGSLPSILAIRTSDGAVVRLDVTSATSVSTTPVVVTPPGFSAAGTVSLLGSGDVTGDGVPDLLARTTAGTVVGYPGTASGGFGAASTLVRAVAGYRDVVAAGDLTGDGFTDLVLRKADGTTSLLPSRGARTYGPLVALPASTDVLVP